MNSTPPAIAPAPAAVLSAAAAGLTRLRDIIITHEEKFAALTLGPRLQIGLLCLRAFHVFAIPDTKRKGIGGRPKNSVTRDSVLAQGFEGWLKTENEWLKKPTAYKYMTAVRGLGLDHSATEEAVDAALAQHLRVGPVTLKLLCDMAVDPLAPAAPVALLEQTEFEFIRAGLSAFREEAAALIAMAERLRQIPEAHRAACARAYHLLHELTGTDWSPSDTPDPLAGVDPDTLTL